DSAFKWLVGYFYQDFESEFDEFAYTPLTAIPGTIPNAFTQYQPTKLLQNSLFGEVSYTFLRRLTATAGLRRYYYHGSVNDAVSGWLSSSGTDAFDHFATGERNSGVTPKFNLADQLNKDLLVYGTAAEGFRPGGGNQPIPTAGPLGAQCLQNLESFGLSSAPLGFSPDNVWSYELGEKFSDGRLRLNSAGYFEHWEHIQQNIPLACGFPFTGNAGDAHIYGAELELGALLMPGLVAEVNGGWTHAQFVANAVPDSTIDERVQNVPQITASASLTYRHGLTQEFGLLARVDNDYVGSRIDTTAQANYLPPYDLTNIRAGLEGDNWSAILFVNNATNRRALLTDTPSITVNSSLYNRIAVEQPLTFGIDLNYQFGGSRP
ncbi:MAG: TonB-dependent receptor, partial [Acidobacteriaceae bacterium]